MNEVERTIEWVREKARQDDTEFIALCEGGVLCWCGSPPTGPGCIGYAPAESDAAVELVRRSIKEFGMHWLSGARLKGGEDELAEEMGSVRKMMATAKPSDETIRRVAERHLRREHAVLRCTLPMPGGGHFLAWLNPDGNWETDHPGISDECLTRAVKAFLAVLEEE